MVENLDRKEREEFDATLNSGVSSGSWAHIQARAFERLESGEFDSAPIGDPITGTDVAYTDVVGGPQ